MSQISIIELLQNIKEATAEDISKKLGTHYHTIVCQLSKLVKKGIVNKKHVRYNKYHYELTSQKDRR